MYFRVLNKKKKTATLNNVISLDLKIVDLKIVLFTLQRNA